MFRKLFSFSGIALLSTAIVQLADPIVSGAISIGIQPATASKQTDRQWQQYLGGRKIVEFSNYSSSFGGGGMSSQKELHICGNGQFAYAAQSSVSMNVSGANGGSSGRNRSTGTWKIIESNQSGVAVEFTSSTGEKEQGVLGFGQDGRLYNGDGKKLLTAPSESCQ